MSLDRLIIFILLLFIVPTMAYYIYISKSNPPFQGISPSEASHNVAEKKNLKILALGDSLTDGYGVNRDDAFPELLENHLNSQFKEYKTTVINAGISGSTSASAVSRLKKFFDKDIDVMLLALGINDGLRGHSLSKMKENLQQTIDLAQSHNIKVVLAGMILPPNYGIKRRKEFKEVFQELASKNKLPFIPFLLEGVGGKPALNISDRIHPNEKGHKIILKTISPFFKLFYK